MRTAVSHGVVSAGQGSAVLREQERLSPRLSEAAAPMVTRALLELGVAWAPGVSGGFGPACSRRTDRGGVFDGLR